MAERLSAGEAASLARAPGAVIVDLRDPAEFAEGHPSGAISLRHDPRRLAERLAAVVPEGTPLVLVATGDDESTDAERQLAGTFRVLGSGAAEADGWRAGGVEWEPLAAIATDALAGDGRARFHVLDVREPMEWATGHVPGAQLISLGELRQRIDEVPRDGEIAVICEAGVRSATAASLLRASGFPHVVNVADGSAGYRRGGHPLEITEESEEDA